MLRRAGDPDTAWREFGRGLSPVTNSLDDEFRQQPIQMRRVAVTAKGKGRRAFSFV